MNILRIDASARLERSLTRKLATHFLETLLAGTPDSEVAKRDVGVTPPDFLTEAWIAAAFTPEKQRTEQDRRVLAESDQLIAEVKAADLILIATPLYNYGMPASLKAWFDQVVRIGRTFSFDLSRGDVPIEPTLSGKTLVILTSSGEFGFEPGGIRHADDHLVPHIQTIAKYLGAETIEIIRIEYQEFGDQRHDHSVERAFQNATTCAQKLTRSLNTHRAHKLHL
ncbi:FMN-dependent NADH-azoreductase [Epibacterium ulvae]|uniref:FMN-dependent NADH-azoreductase n=1 Tax=Epibacterium ulvae TaxID=1156985 RepID=UPI00249398A4|nr:NAD(P)H-dependent oxidoreductase [Epibacterium ulvae]